MKNNLNAFEQGLRDKMENFEMPHSEQEWLAIQNSVGHSSLSFTKYLIIGGIVLGVGGALSLHFWRAENGKITCQKAENDIRFVETFNMFDMPHPSNVLEQDAQQVGDLNFQSVNNSDSRNILSAQSNSNLFSSQEDKSVPVNDSNSKAEIENISPSNIIGLASNVRKACMGEEVLFSMSNGPKGGSYLWNFGDGHFSDESNPKHRFNKAGKYDVSLSITTDDGQINTTVMSDMINIIESPDAYFFWEFADGVPGEPVAIIREESSGADTYQWTLPNGEEISDREPGRLKLLSGSNKILLKASNKNGCFTEVERTIVVKENSDPNVIHGGESFMPTFLKKNKGRFVLSIFDSSGNKVYETSNRTKGWDSKIGHTHSANSIFRWKAIITDEKSDESQYVFGTFNIQP
jgi:PKD repeat protein